MRPDAVFVKERFKAFNALIFDGELPEVEIVISKSKSYLGRLEYKQRRKLFASPEIYDIKMRVSARVDLPQSDVEDTIIHEMIHLYILVKGLKDSSIHGVIFCRKALEINDRFGRKVSVSHRFTEQQQEELLASLGSKTHFVAYLKLTDGRVGLKVIPYKAESLARFKRRMLLGAGIREVRYYKSDNMFFNRYPCSSAPKIQLIDEAVLLEQLAGAEMVG